MISHVRLLTYIVCFGVAAAIGLSWGLGAVDHDGFTVLESATDGTRRTIDSDTPEPTMFESYSIHTTGDPNDGPWTAGSSIYQMGGTFATADGGSVSHSVRFGTAGYVEIECKDVVRRAIDDRFCQSLLHYEVSIRGAISNDDTEHCLTHVVSSRGTTDCGITPILRYQPIARRLDVTLDETLFGDRRQYDFSFRIDEKGAISSWTD